MRIARRGFLGLLAAPAVARAQSPALVSPNVPWRHISGLEVMRLDAHRLYVVRGAAADNEGRVLIEVARQINIDIREIGALGRDDVATEVDVRRFGSQLAADASMPHGYRATYAAGHRWAGRPIEGWYYPVYLGSEGGGRRAGSAMVTRQLSSMRVDGAGNARAPAGFPVRRHAPMAFFYEPETGFRPMTCAAWPQPICNWTHGGTRAAYALLVDGASTQWQMVEAGNWIPETGRLLRLQAVLRSNGGRGGAYAKPLPQRQDDLLLGWVNQPGDRAVNFFELATTSREQFVYRVDEGVTLSLYAMGFALLQPQ